MKLRATALILALAASSLAWGEALDPPQRLARLNYVEGEMSFQGAQTPATSTLPDRPLMIGDRLATENGGRAELVIDTATIRLDQDSEFSFVYLGETTVRVELTAGTASLHLRELLENETFEIVTPNAAITFHEPGEYRVDIFTDGATELTVRAGVAEVTTAGGPVRVAAGQRVRLDGRDALARLETSQPTDDFDDWVLEREVKLAEAEPPRYTPYEDNNYEELDRYGQWYDEPSYGRVWMPSYAYGGRDPFGYGHWERIGFGWSWIDSMPWGYYTFNYGRWAYLHHQNRWCWVPERREHRPHVAQETHPFGRPRDADPRRHDDEPQRVATSTGFPRRFEPDRRPGFLGDADTGKPARRGTVVPANQNPDPPPQSAPAPRGGGTTMQPSRPEGSRGQAAPQPTSRAKGAFATPQDP